MKTYDKVFIDGRWVPAGGEPIDVFEPGTGMPWAQVYGTRPAGVDQAVQAARRAFPAWSNSPREVRLRYLSALQKQLEARTDELAATVTREVGMPISASRAVQIQLPTGLISSYMKVLEEYEFVEPCGNAQVERTPVGVVGCITPWNYPLNQVIMKVIPALAAGCTVVLKPSEVAPLTAFMLAEALEAIDFPPGVLNIVCGLGGETGQALIEHPDVDMLSFTGSTATGRRVYQAAAEDFKRVALELGGKSAAVVLPDGDLQAAIRNTMGMTCLNSGQTCIALTRLVVPESLHDQACELAAAMAEAFQPGDPLDEKTRLGPLASAAQRDKVQEYIQIGIDEGHRLVAGGLGAPTGLEKGYFVKPTIFGNVDPQSRLAQEEIFGPVLCIIPYRDDDEAQAIGIANGTPYGLSGAVWSADTERAGRVASQLRTGQVFVNGARPNPFAPFGGFGHSGVGREKGKWGMEEFLEIRTVYY